MSEPLSIVLRLQRVKLARAELEDRLGVNIDRFEIDTDDTAYAQIHIPESDHSWITVQETVGAIGAILKGMLAAGDVASVSLDIAAMMSRTALSKSFTVPAALIKSVGEAGIDLDLSVYRTTD